MGILPGARTDVVDLRTRQHELDRLPRRTRHLYLAGLAVIAAMGLAEWAGAVAMAVVPTGLPVELEVEDGAVAISGLAEGSSLTEGWRVRSVDGRVLGDAAGEHSLMDALAAVGSKRETTLGVLPPEAPAGAAPNEVVVALRPTGWPRSVDALLTGAWSILIAALGFLALRARESTGAIRRFLDLCLLAALPVMVISPVVYFFLFTRPWTAAVTGLPGGLVTMGFMLAALAVWPFLFGAGLLRFLRVFPSPDEEVARHFGFPRFSPRVGWALRATAVLAVVLTGVALAGVGDGIGPVRVGFAVGWGVVLGLTGIVLLALPISWLVRTAATVFRLARWRLRHADAEEARRTRSVFAGVRIGALLFGLAVLVTLVLSPTLDVTGGTPVTELVMSLLIMAAVTAPFLGMAVGVTRRGLWDVDLVVRRATLYSALGGVFVVAWAGADVLLEALIPSGAFGMGPILAAAAVGTVGRPLGRRLTRRLFPDAGDFPSAVERVSERLSLDPSADPATRLRRALTAGLEPDRCVVLTGGTAFPPPLSHPPDWDPAPVADAVRARLEAAPSVVVETDEGPLLAFRVGPSPDIAMVILGARPGGHFYTSEDRRLLAVLVNPLTPVFQAAPA